MYQMLLSLESICLIIKLLIFFKKICVIQKKIIFESFGHQGMKEQKYYILLYLLFIVYIFYFNFKNE